MKKVDGERWVFVIPDGTDLQTNDFMFLYVNIQSFIKAMLPSKAKSERRAQRYTLREQVGFYGISEGLQEQNIKEFKEEVGNKLGLLKDGFKVK